MGSKSSCGQLLWSCLTGGFCCCGNNHNEKPPSPVNAPHSLTIPTAPLSLITPSSPSSDKITPSSPSSSAAYTPLVTSADIITPSSPSSGIITPLSTAAHSPLAASSSAADPLAIASSSTTPSAPSSAAFFWNPLGILPHSSSTTPSSDPAAFFWNPPQPLTVELLDKLLDLLDKQQSIKTDGTSDPASTADVVKDYIASVDGLLQGIPDKKKKEMQGRKMMMARDSFMPILTKVLQGASQSVMSNPVLGWAAMGIGLLAWALDTIYITAQNAEDCLDILSRIRSLLRSMRPIMSSWESSQHPTPPSLHIEIESALLRVVGLAFKAVVLSDSCRKKSRYFKATSLKDIVTNLKDEIQDTRLQIISIQLSCNKPTPLKRQPTDVEDEGMVGRDEEKKDALDFLMESYGKEVRAICLHGMGGIGKTTLGLAIFKELQRVFVCCREELPLDVKDVDLPKYQKAIIEKITNSTDVPNISNTREGRQQLIKVLRNTKSPVLLYIDNLLNEKHVNELLPQLTFLPRGLRIIVATRDKAVAKSIESDLHIKQCKPIEMKGLNRIDADSILMQQVWRKFGDLEEEEQQPGESSAIGMSGDLERVKDEMLRFCNGLPLAIKVVGASIANNKPDNPMSKEAWEETAAALRSTKGSDDSLENELYKPLEYSITCLSDSLRKGLFDVVHMMDVEFLKWEMVECLIGEKELRNLMDRHLLEKTDEEWLDGYRPLPGIDGASIKCHDVVKAVIKRMARKSFGEENLFITSGDEVARSQLARIGELQFVVSLHGSAKHSDFIEVLKTTVVSDPQMLLTQLLTQPEPEVATLLLDMVLKKMPATLRKSYSKTFLELLKDLALTTPVLATRCS